MAVVCSTEDLLVCCVEVLQCSVSKERFCVHCLLVVPYYDPLVITDPEGEEDSANRSRYLLQDVLQIVQSVEFVVHVSSLVLWEDYERFGRVYRSRACIWEDRLVARS